MDVSSTLLELLVLLSSRLHSQHGCGGRSGTQRPRRRYNCPVVLLSAVGRQAVNLAQGMLEWLSLDYRVQFSFSREHVLAKLLTVHTYSSYAAMQRDFGQQPKVIVVTPSDLRLGAAQEAFLAECSNPDSCVVFFENEIRARHMKPPASSGGDLRSILSACCPRPDVAHPSAFGRGETAAAPVVVRMYKTIQVPLSHAELYAFYVAQSASFTASAGAGTARTTADGEAGPTTGAAPSSTQSPTGASTDRATPAVMSAVLLQPGFQTENLGIGSPVRETAPSSTAPRCTTAADTAMRAEDIPEISTPTDEDEGEEEDNTIDAGSSDSDDENGAAKDVDFATTYLAFNAAAEERRPRTEENPQTLVEATAPSTSSVIMTPYGLVSTRSRRGAGESAQHSIGLGHGLLKQLEASPGRQPLGGSAAIRTRARDESAPMTTGMLGKRLARGVAEQTESSDVASQSSVIRIAPLSCSEDYSHQIRPEKSSAHGGGAAAGDEEDDDNDNDVDDDDEDDDKDDQLSDNSARRRTTADGSGNQLPRWRRDLRAWNNGEDPKRTHVIPIQVSVTCACAVVPSITSSMESSTNVDCGAVATTLVDGRSAKFSEWATLLLDIWRTARDFILVPPRATTTTSSIFSLLVALLDLHASSDANCPRLHVLRHYCDPSSEQPSPVARGGLSLQVNRWCETVIDVSNTVVAALDHERGATETSTNLAGPSPAQRPPKARISSGLDVNKSQRRTLPSGHTWHRLAVKSRQTPCLRAFTDPTTTEEPLEPLAGIFLDECSPVHTSPVPLLRLLHYTPLEELTAWTAATTGDFTSWPANGDSFEGDDGVQSCLVGPSSLRDIYQALVGARTWCSTQLPPLMMVGGKIHYAPDPLKPIRPEAHIQGCELSVAEATMIHSLPSSGRRLGSNQRAVVVRATLGPEYFSLRQQMHHSLEQHRFGGLFKIRQVVQLRETNPAVGDCGS